jgi:hypothetical protein
VFFIMSSGVRRFDQLCTNSTCATVELTGEQHVQASFSEARHVPVCLQVKELRNQHQSDLLAQIAENSEKRKLERAAVREAGRQAAKDASDYMAKIECIKQKKLKELEEAGVPAKYCAELIKYKVGQSGV